MADRRVTKPDHFQAVTDRIVSLLEQGTPPWRRPWDPTRAAPTGPVNGATGHRYRGINTLLLGMSPRAFETGDPRWCSYRQAQQQGWHVRRGETASTVFFFKVVDLENDGVDEERRQVAVLRSYPVFHASQIDGVPSYSPPSLEEAPWRAPDAAETILRRSGATVREAGERAFYSPATDHIQLPSRVAFATAAGWTATALHELAHWTGHPSRLDRDLTGRFASRAYAQEELRAELASAFLSAELGIPADLPGHASYVASWLDTLRQDKREIFRAAADAQRAVNYVLGFHPAYAVHVAADQQPVTDDAGQANKSAATPPVMPAGPMPAHIRRRLRLDPESIPNPAAPVNEETPTWTYRPGR